MRPLHPAVPPVAEDEPLIVPRIVQSGGERAVGDGPRAVGVVEVTPPGLQEHADVLPVVVPHQPRQVVATSNVHICMDKVLSDPVGKSKLLQGLGFVEAPTHRIRSG